MPTHFALFASPEIRGRDIAENAVESKEKQKENEKNGRKEMMKNEKNG